MTLVYSKSLEASLRKNISTKFEYAIQIFIKAFFTIQLAI